MKQENGDSRLRIDSKHAFSSASSSENRPPNDPPFALERGEQLQTQAAELASHLQARQTELNRREMQLNAFAAQLENEQRQQRLLASEKERTGHGATEEHSSPHFTARRLSGDNTAVATASPPLESAGSIDHLRAEIDREHEQLALREAAIAARESELERQELQILEKSQRTQLRERERKIAAEVAALALSLEKDALELQQQRQELDARCLEFDARVEAKQQELASTEAALTEDARQKSATLLQQQDDITQHHALLESLRRELDQLHHDSMNMRLEAEELAQQLAQQHGDRAVSQTLPELRARISESFQQQIGELEQRQAEVQQLLKRLQIHEASLQTQQHNLTQWADRREAELQRQASKLIARERALDDREVQLRQLEAQRQDERLAERNEIWTLQRKLASCIAAEKKGGTVVPPQ